MRPHLQLICLREPSGGSVYINPALVAGIEAAGGCVTVGMAGEVSFYLENVNLQDVVYALTGDVRIVTLSPKEERGDE